MTEPNVNKEPGFIRYVMAANRTGGGSVFIFLIASLIFYPLGYYHHYTSTKNKNTEVVIQSINNNDIDKVVEKKQNENEGYLNQSLAHIGYNTDNVKDLTKNKPDRLDRLKGKFTTFIKGKTVYLPKDNCDNDYLGEDSSDEINKIILDGFHRRYKPNG